MADQRELDGVLSTAIATGIIGMAMGIARGIIHQKYGSFGHWFRGILAALVVSVLVGLGVADSSLPITMQFAVVGGCAFVADDVLLGLAALMRLLGADPIGFFSRMLDAYRGTRKAGNDK